MWNFIPILILILTLCLCICTQAPDDSNDATPITTHTGTILTNAIRVRRRNRWHIDATPEFIKNMSAYRTAIALNNGNYLIAKNDEIIEVTPIQNTYK